MLGVFYLRLMYLFFLFFPSFMHICGKGAFMKNHLPRKQKLELSRVMLLVGHGWKKNGAKIFHVKNTWGEHWCARCYGLVLADLVLKVYHVMNLQDKVT